MLILQRRSCTLAHHHLTGDHAVSSASVDDRHQERSDIHVASTSELYDSILDVCAKRMDAWSLEVQGRWQSCHDFIDADAVYHQECSVNFRLRRNKSELDLSCLSDKE